MLEDWVTAVGRELDLPADLDVDAVLDLARDVAHGVARPAAPLTAFLVGLAAGRDGGIPRLRAATRSGSPRWPGPGRVHLHRPRTRSTRGTPPLSATPYGIICSPNSRDRRAQLDLSTEQDRRDQHQVGTGRDAQQCPPSGADAASP